MGTVAIRAEGLGKRYRIGEREPYLALRDVLTRRVRSVLRRNPSRARRHDVGHIWALRDVSFDIEEGSAVGVIGANGAGKSTLLKVLSRITRPTEGWAEIHGGVGSLLEVGTGFHPELTGRENVFMSGAILGMGKREIEHKFDAIVDFAEIPRFIDTPVKHYSSGMYVRLAFAVAAHLEPEILLIDEVLAVGDVGFQRKCLGKMGDVASQGRTVLFVSHNMGAVRQLCTKAMWIDNGEIRLRGDPGEVVDAYLHEQDQSGEGAWTKLEDDPGKDAQIVEARLLTSDGRNANAFDCDHPVIFELTYRIRRTVPQLYGYFEIRKADGTTVLVSDSHDVGANPLDRLPPGIYRACITLPPRSLAPGEYSVRATLASPASTTTHTIDRPGTLLHFSLADTRTARGNRRQGFFSTLLDWAVAPNADD